MIKEKRDRFKDEAGTRKAAAWQESRPREESQEEPGEVRETKSKGGLLTVRQGDVQGEQRARMESVGGGVQRGEEGGSGYGGLRGWGELAGEAQRGKGRHTAPPRARGGGGAGGGIASPWF